MRKFLWIRREFLWIRRELVVSSILWRKWDFFRERKIENWESGLLHNSQISPKISHKISPSPLWIRREKLFSPYPFMDQANPTPLCSTPPLLCQKHNSCCWLPCSLGCWFTDWHLSEAAGPSQGKFKVHGETKWYISWRTLLSWHRFRHWIPHSLIINENGALLEPRS